MEVIHLSPFVKLPSTSGKACLLYTASDDLAAKLPEILASIQHDLFEKAKKHRDSHTYEAHNKEEMKDLADNKPGFIKAMWCGCRECEDAMKEEFGAVSYTHL